MELGHDTEDALTRVVALVNSSPATGGPERLPDVVTLAVEATRLNVSAVGELATDDLDGVRALRERFHRVFLAADDPTAVAEVNAILLESRTAPHLTNHDGYSWHIHYFAAGTPLAERLASDGGMALAFVIATGERERLRSCEAPGCRRVLVDLSRNRSRRYCDSRTCGNRLHVAAYRARRREAARVGGDG